MTDATAPDARAAVDELRIAAAGPIEPGVSTSDLTLVSRTSLHTVLALLSDNGVMWLAERNEELRDERDALAARVAELGEPTVEWTVALDGETGSPLPEKLARRMSRHERTELMTRTAYRNPPWQPAVKAVDAPGAALSATETAEESVR